MAFFPESRLKSVISCSGFDGSSDALLRRSIEMSDDGVVQGARDQWVW